MSTADTLAPRAPRKARALIDNLLQSRQLTPEGMCWLTIATDPFHDTELRPCGYPDMNTCGSITQCYTLTTNVVAPATLTTTTYDAHVFLNPLTCITNLTGTDNFISAVNYTPQNAVITPFVFGTRPIYGGVNVVTLDNGRNWTKDTSPFLWTNTPQVSFPASACGGQYRLIGGGVEVVNTTPDLYRGGSVTCYRSPSAYANRNTQALVPTTGAFVGTSVYALPPGSQTEAQLYPSTRTWAAEEGVYMIFTMSDDENPFIIPTPVVPMWITPPTAAQSNTPGTTIAWSYQPALIGALSVNQTNAQVVPFDSIGAIFSGLNVNSTLQVTVKYYMERIPTISEPDLLVLVRPPSPSDDLAKQIYTRVLEHMPVGCMVKENPLGEWFNDILSTLAEVAPVMGKALGNPIASMVGSGIGLGAAEWLKARNAEVKQTPKQNTNNSSNNNNNSGKIGKKKRQRKRKQKSSSNKASTGPASRAGKNFVRSWK